MKSYLIIILSFLIFNIVSAQTARQLSQNVLNEIEVLKKADLNLSDVQLSRITAVLVSQEELFMKNKQALEGNKIILEQRMKELKGNKVNNILGAMTDQQVEKFKAMKLEDKF